MQRLSQDFFKDRSLYYSLFPIRAQAVPGRWNYELKETVMVCLLEFSFDDTHPDQLLHEVKLMEKQSGRVFNDHVTYWYIETPKFRKRESELKTRLDQWLFVLTGMAKFTEIPVTLREDELFKSFFMTAETAQLMEQELMAYYASQKEQWDRYAVEETAEHRGERRGKEEATEKNKTTFITNLVQATDFSDEKIAHLAEVSVAFVQQIKKRLESK
jgi:predicted transposase/invertase (TIGR01784 family)